MKEKNIKITNNVFDYLKELKANNNREWFVENKDRYQQIRLNFERFFDALIQEIHKFDEDIGIQTADKCMYRIYRDIRFSKDKTPYKVHIAAFIALGGYKQHSMPGYYLHIEDNASCAGAGIYLPPPKDLEKIRKEIYYNIEEFKGIINSLDFRKYYDGFSNEDKLKKTPKNFPIDFPDIELLKNKNYSVINSFSNEKVLSEDFFDYILQCCKAAFPLNQFLMRALNY